MHVCVCVVCFHVKISQFSTLAQSGEPCGMLKAPSHQNLFRLWPGDSSAVASARLSALTCPGVRAVERRLGGVSQDGGPHAVEAVLLGVLLQPRLFRAHQVVVAVASGRDQLRDTELLLQQWEGRPVACQRRDR